MKVWSPGIFGAALCSCPEAVFALSSVTAWSNSSQSLVAAMKFTIIAPEVTADFLCHYIPLDFG